MFPVTSPVSSPPGRMGRPPPAGFWSSVIGAKNGWSACDIPKSGAFAAHRLIRSTSGTPQKKLRVKENNGILNILCFRCDSDQGETEMWTKSAASRGDHCLLANREEPPNPRYKLRLDIGMSIATLVFVAGESEGWEQIRGQQIGCLCYPDSVTVLPCEFATHAWLPLEYKYNNTMLTKSLAAVTVLSSLLLILTLLFILGIRVANTRQSRLLQELVGFDLTWIETIHHWEPSDPSRILQNNPCQKHRMTLFPLMKRTSIQFFLPWWPCTTSSHLIPHGPMWSQVVPLASSRPHHRSAAPWSAHKDPTPTTKPLRETPKVILKNFPKKNSELHWFTIQSKLACSM